MDGIEVVPLTGIDIGTGAAAVGAAGCGDGLFAVYVERLTAEPRTSMLVASSPSETCCPTNMHGDRMTTLGSKREKRERKKDFISTKHLFVYF